MKRPAHTSTGASTGTFTGKSSGIRRAFRWLKRVAIGVGGLLLLTTLLLLLLTFTQPGRDLIRDVATEQTNGIIPGAIEIDAIEQLNLSGVKIRGIRISTPDGKAVAEIGRIFVQPNWSGILAGAVELDRVEIEDAWVDAKDIDKKNSGLLAAFVNPDAPSAPPSDTPPPEIQLHQIHLEQIRAQLPPLPKLGQLQVSLNTLKGTLSLNDGIPAGQIDVLDVTAHRGDTALVTLHGDATVPVGKSTSRAALKISAGTIQTTCTVTAVLPIHPGWEKAPASLRLDVTGVSAAQLADILNDPSLKDAFKGEVALNLAAKGKNGRFNLQGAVVTDAGKIRFDDLQLRQKQMRLQLSTDSFDLRALKDDLPKYTIATRLSLETTGMPPQPVQFALHMDQSKINNIPFPKVAAKGEYLKDAINRLALTIHEPHGRIDAEGTLRIAGDSRLKTQVNLQAPLIKRLGKMVGQNLDGELKATANVRRQASGHIAASGKMTLQDVAYGAPSKRTPPDLKIQKMTAQFDASGSPQRLSGTLAGQITHLVNGNRQLDDATVHISGAPDDFAVRLDARGGMGPRDSNGKRPKKKRARLALAAKIKRSGTSTAIQGHGTGHIQGRPIKFNLARTVITDNGAFNSDGVDVTFAGQRLSLNGRLSPRKQSDGLVVMDVGPITLNRIPEVLAIHPDLVGTIEGQIRIRGTSNIPVVTLAVSGHQLGLAGRPLIDAAIEASLNTREGTAQVTASLKNPAGLGVSANASATFKGGANWLQRIHLAEVDSTIEVTALKSFFLEPYFPEMNLPFVLTTGALVHAKGTLQDPRLEIKSRADIWLLKKKPVTILLGANYASGTVSADLKVNDEKGAFAELDGTLTLQGPPPAVPEMGAAFTHAAADSVWQLSMTVEERSLTDIPLIGSFIDRETLPPVNAGLKLVAQHDGVAEPSVHLELEATQSSSLAVNGCEAEDMALTAIFDHNNNEENRLTVTGTQHNQQLLSLEASLPLSIRPILQGETPTPGPLNFTLNTRRLKLSQVPFVCGVAEGEIEGSVAGNDVLGAYPQITAELCARSFSLGSKETVDINISTTALAEELLVSGQIRQSGNSDSILGHVSAQMPVRFSDGAVSIDNNIPIDVQVNLHRLPVAPLLPPEGAVSYVRGVLNGNIKASGHLDSPQIHGRMALQDMAFTSTSLAQPLRGVQGELIFNGRQIEVTHFEAHDRDGTLTLKGEVDVTDMDRIRGKMHITADDFPLRQQGEVVAITNFDAVAESTVTRERTDARLTLNDVDTWLESVAPRTGIDLAAHEEFVIDGIPAPGSKLAEELSENNDVSGPMPEGGTATDDADRDADSEIITIIIEGEKNFWVKRKDFAVKLNTTLKTEIVDDDVRVNGDVTIDRGYLQLLGREFDLAPDSVVRFTGSNPPNPALALAADYNTRGGSIVGVKISGRANAPEIIFLLEGDEVDASIAMAEIFGADSAQTDADASTQAQSFVSGLTAGVLATTARRELGAAAPIIMIDPAQTAGEGRVRAGFELDSIVPKFLRPIVTGVYLEGIVERESEGDAGAETQFGALLELYFPKKFFTAAQYGPGTTWSLDIGWQL